MKARYFSLADLLGFLICGLVVLSIGLVRIQRYRTAARATTCENNLKQLGLAIHNYHSAYKRLPMGCGGSSATVDGELWQNNQDRLSPWVGLSPFAEQQALWEKIANPMQVGSITFPSMGPAPWYDEAVYTPWAERPDLFACPSDKDAAKFKKIASYTLNYGDAVHMVGSPQVAMTGLKANAIRASNRGLFFGTQSLRFRDCLDGLSNTLMFSEACIANQPVAKNVAGLASDPSRCITASGNKRGEFWPPGRESCWADGCLRSVGFQTILPPNSPSCTADDSDLEGVMSASSYHADGVHVAFADGAVLFVLDSIDAGKSTSPTVAIMGDGKNFAMPGSPSPYGLWGAMGTRANKENVDRDDENIVPPPKELSDFEKERLQASPLQTWTAANGRSTLKARQVELQRESSVILLTEGGEVRRVRLSQLDSKSAYRAVQQHLAEKLKARAELKDQLQAGVEMLNNKKLKEFAVQFMPGGENDPESMANIVQLERGLLIYRFEMALRDLESANAQGVQFSELDSGEVTVRFPTDPRQAISSRLRLIYANGRWQFGLR